MTQSRVDSETEAEQPLAAESRAGIDRWLILPLHHWIPIGTVLGAILLWELISRFAFARLELVFPSIVEITGELYWMFSTGAIYPHLRVTSQEVAVAFFLAAVVGIIGGSALGSSEFVADGIEPILYYFSSIPKIVLYPLFLVALGIGLESKIAMGFLSALFPITVNSITGALSVRTDFVKVARVYGASRFTVFRYVYLPSTITHIINGLRLGVGVSIISVVLAELFASRSGLGNLIQFYFSNLQTARMYAVLVVLFGASLLLNLSLLRIQQYLLAKGYGAGEHGDTSDGVGF